MYLTWRNYRNSGDSLLNSMLGDRPLLFRDFTRQIIQLFHKGRQLMVSLEISKLSPEFRLGLPCLSNRARWRPPWIPVCSGLGGAGKDLRDTGISRILVGDTVTSPSFQVQWLDFWKKISLHTPFVCLYSACHPDYLLFGFAQVGCLRVIA